MATVLCTGAHEMFIATRKLILECAGHTVHIAMSSSEIISHCRSFKFDVAVIGQSNDPETKREWAKLVREHCPETKILEIYIPQSGSSVSFADSWLESPTIPDKLAARIAALSPRPARLEQIRELCTRVIKAEGAEFKDAIRELSNAIDQHLEARQKKDDDEGKKPGS